MSSVVDPIADMLTRIRNRIMRGYSSVNVPVSVFKGSILDCLVKEGYVESYKTQQIEGSSFNEFVINLKVDSNNKPIIQRLVRVSKPSKKEFIKNSELRPVLKNGIKTRILSTSQGVMSDREILKSDLKIGGEYLFTVE